MALEIKHRPYGIETYDTTIESSGASLATGIGSSSAQQTDFANTVIDSGQSIANYLVDISQGSSDQFYLYNLVDGEEVVYIGISSNPIARADHHLSRGIKFSQLAVEKEPMGRDTAIKREHDALEYFRRNLGRGNYPKYMRQFKVNIRRALQQFDDN